MKNELYNQIEKFYRENLSKTKVCDECGAKCDQHILGMWHCGYDAIDGIMFVGKTGVTDEKYIDIPKETSPLITREKYQSVFWRYIIELSKSKYGEDYLNKICVTNLIKCNAGTNNDKTTEKMLKNCMKNNYLIEEIKIVKPKYIVFLLNNWYKDQLINGELKKYIKQTIQDKLVMVGKQEMPRCEFKIEVNGKISDCLLVGHPQGKENGTYINIIKSFLDIK